MNKQIPFPNKKYQIIYADPPWNLKYLKETKKGINVYDLPYPTMGDKEIIELPVEQIADTNAVLFLWCVDNKIPLISDIMQGWGFKYVNVGFVWNKIAKTTNGVNATLSKYTRKSCEFCYIGKRGKYIVKKPSTVNQIINIPKEKHSKKPSAIRDRIVKLMGDLPRIELFARQKVDGWDCWGNEV